MKNETLILDMEYKIKFAGEHLIQQMQQVIRNAENAIDKTEQGLVLNGLGELQATALSADVAVARLTALQESLKLITDNS